ncbi:hypothetical protein V1511DRAFT_462235 [Dipodascopsis uninucleata]
MIPLTSSQVSSDQSPLSSSAPPLPSSSSTSNLAVGSSYTGNDAGSSALSATPKPDDEEPSIRMTAFIDHSSTTPALYFEPIERKGRPGNVIRLGRYTDKKEISKAEQAYAPVVFKSKVVSRSHAEIWMQNGQWYVKDIRSSSGTFLNHIRLAPACQMSQAFPIKDGDILQLGMDFRGGSEEVYKCVKMRLEVNRSWQKRINNFNVSAHTRLQNLTGPLTSAGAGNSNQQQECSICLVSVAPCQSLFVAPCSHVWHYKCIRPIIIKNYPQFLCPNCRAVCDLEAEVEVPEQPMLLEGAEIASSSSLPDAADIKNDVQGGSSSDAGSGASTSNQDADQDNINTDEEDKMIATPARSNVMTPPNEVGPFVFDGMIVSSAGTTTN